MAKAARSRKTNIPTVVVGIGASAGGFRALKEFFAHVKNSPNACFLVAQHLDESGRRLALEALRSLSPLTVQELKTGTVLQANIIYAVPPHQSVSFKSGKVHLETAKTTAKKLCVINHLFAAIGDEFGAAAIGIVLSGNASDGSGGVKSLNAAGGLSLAQSPDTCEHPSMPEAAIQTGTVDYVLPPKGLWKEVASYVEYVLKSKEGPDRTALKEQITAAITTICEIVQEKTRHDFKHYKTSTLMRRIQRRMQVLQIIEVGEYIDYLRGKNDESEVLFNELLINVTNFFRDKESFEFLKTSVLKTLLENGKPNQKVRIWIAGCSTGEESYTMAILLRELLEKMDKPPEIQIIATDIDDNALNVARKGAYPATIAEHVSQERLAKYFTKRAGKYHIVKDVREMCLFSVHNLITDPPFSQLDLISCRNVLIYLGLHLQKKLFPVFHYALRAGGYLFLGNSETLATHKELFKPISAKHRIAQRKPTAIRLPPISASVQNYLSHFQESEKISEADIGLIGQRIALDEMPMRYAVVNDEGQIISSSAGINKYVQFPEGPFANNIVKLVAPSLRPALRTAMSVAKKEKRKVTNDTCNLRFENIVERTLVIVQPMPQLGDMSELYWVAFQSLGAVTNREAMNAKPSSDDQSEMIEQLERELGILRQELDKSVQDLEASNEELKSSNEELLSMNEELQSANEELEASKEEVQHSNDALHRANTDLENLLSSTQIATLFLDDNYQIRGFTPTIQEIYNINPSDIGRNLYDFSSRSKAMPDYPQVESLSWDIPHESELTLPSGRIYLRRILPYRTNEKTREGIVVTFIDVTELRKSEGRFYTMANTVPQMTWVADATGKVEFYNQRWFEYTGQSPEEAEGWGWKDVIHPDDLAKALEDWNKSARSGEDYNTEYRMRRHDGIYRWHRASAVPFRDEAGKITNWFGVDVDIHKAREKVDAITISESHFRTLVDNSPAIMWITDREAKCTYLSKQWYETTGGTPERDLGFGWVESVHPGDKEEAAKAFFTAVNARGRISIRYRLRHKDGKYRWAVDSGLPLISETGEFLGYIGTVIDIHDQIENEKMLSDLTTRFERSANATNLGVWYCDLPFDELMWNKEVKRHFFMPQDQRVTIQDFYSHIHPEDRQMTEDAIQKSIETRAPYDIVYRTIDPNDSSKLNYIRAIGWTDYDENSKPIRFDGITLDVSDHIKARKIVEHAKNAIEVERQNFRNLLKESPELCCILIGPEHRFDFVNEAHIKVLGFDATGQTVREAQPESVEIHHILDSVYRTGKTAHLHEIPVTVGARLRYFNLTYAPYRDLDDQIIGILILGAEITEQVDQRIRIEKESKAAEAANLAKTRFLANMSHEIRTPLSAIVGFSELLRTKMGSDPDTDAYIDRISRNSGQLSRLIDELLDLSKIEADKLELEQSKVNLEVLLEDVYSAMVLKASEKSLQLNFTWSSEKPQFLFTDPVRLSQILINIIGNAVKFTEKGSVTADFCVHGNALRVRVIDTGIGLSSEQQQKIFVPFTQADPSVTRKYGGTGLGLALSKKLAQLLGGDLVLETSELGVGTTFLVTVMTNLSEVKSSVSVDTSGLTRIKSDTLAGKTVLVVDDSLDNRTIVTAFLKGAGARTIEATNGEEAVITALKGTYDLILMDIQMPVLDGYQAMLQLKELEYPAPIVAVTAHAFKEERDRCLSMGFTAYITKPVDKNSLLRLAHDLTRKP